MTRRIVAMIFEHENPNILPTIADVKEVLCGVEPGKKLLWGGREVRMEYVGTDIEVSEQAGS